jgi:hypothetical protein
VPGTNIILTGGVDDIWQDTLTSELIIADYKATSKSGEVTLDAPWQISYKRQAEVYQWLFRQNGFMVSNTAYFVYCNGITKHDRFDKRLHFEIKILPHQGNDSWVLGALKAAHECLGNNDIPNYADNCDHCQYQLAVSKVTQGLPR